MWKNIIANVAHVTRARDHGAEARGTIYVKYLIVLKQPTDQVVGKLVE